jgi:hypothetical protein
MDPIHPITPRPPAIAQIAPAQADRAARERREQRRREQALRERRRDGAGSGDPDSREPFPEDDGPRHIDVRV